MTWMEDARCIDDPDPFFPPGRDPDYDRARWICGGCTVRNECAAEIMERESGQSLTMRFGFQGGMSPTERHKLDPKARSGYKNPLSEQGQELRERLYREGKSDAEIGDCVGRSEHQVRVWRRRNGLAANVAEDDVGRERAELYASGMSDTAMAQQLGTTRDIIRAWRVGAGLSPNDRRGAWSRDAAKESVS